nr:amino acid permease [Candidatus Coxiella mudrowiae]
MFGSSLIFFFILGAIFFLLLSALVAVELSSNSKDLGGIYSWVKSAFGVQFGFLAIWFQWIENVIWYPTILYFITGTIGYLISPTLALAQ